MKRATACILVLTLMFAPGVPALAANETGGDTQLTYSVASHYSIVIPPAVAIRGGVGTGTYGVSAASLIGANKSLSFTITGAANYGGTPVGFRLVNGADADIFLPYTIAIGETPVVKDVAFFTATADQCYAGESVTLTYTTGTAAAAGVYTDIITIAIAEG